MVVKREVRFYFWVMTVYTSYSLDFSLVEGPVHRVVFGEE